MTWKKHEPNKEYQTWELQEVLDEYDNDLTVEEYEKRRSADDPTARTIQRQLGEDVFVTTDASPDDSHNPSDEPERDTDEESQDTKDIDSYTREDCLRAVDELSRRVNGKLTFQEYIEYRRDTSHPPKEAIGRHFKDWDEVLENISDQFDTFELQEALRLANNRVEGELTMKKYRAVKDEKYPPASRIEQEFGNWKSALDTAL